MDLSFGWCKAGGPPEGGGYWYELENGGGWKAFELEGAGTGPGGCCWIIGILEAGDILGGGTWVGGGIRGGGIDWIRGNIPADCGGSCWAIGGCITELPLAPPELLLLQPGGGALKSGIETCGDELGEYFHLNINELI